ncbi:MAG TPA: sulfite exporter TauE/SafE family protein [Candidatus Saccharimonadales bacterium]|nr:sulfite exporter TauE/SafE family protein [Candidatus Saccharimonadales bacterium]
MDLKDILLFGAGLAVGSMNAIAGGGMLMGFPVLLATGLPALIANGTGNVVIFPGQLASAVGYWKYLRKTPWKYAWLLAPWAVGAVIGALLLRRTPSMTFERYVPGLILFAVLLFAFQPFLHHYLHKHLKSRSKRVKPLVIIGIALFPVAIYGGYFGAGVGFIMLAFLGFTKLHDAHQINAMKNVAATVSAAICMVILSHGHFINWHAGLVMAAGSTIGGYAGARYAQSISSHAIRVVVIAIGIVTVTYLGFRSY